MVEDEKARYIYYFITNEKPEELRRFLA